jgi:thymidylate synthase (FAD)
MSVKFVSITEPITGVDGKNYLVSPEELIVYIARVSNPDNQANKATAPKLLKYLINHKHWSPFEFVDMTVEITTRRSIAAQILRHKSFSFQEFSQRYAHAVRIQEIELRKQSFKNRQSSTEEFDPVIPFRKDLTYASKIIEQHMEDTYHLYDTLIGHGVAREVARDVLPLATETNLYMKGSVRSWIHYLQLRMEEDTQKEHREIAEQIAGIFVQKFPVISEIIL